MRSTGPSGFGGDGRSTPLSEHQILVWDGKLFWPAGFAWDRKQGGPPAPLLRALESFRIVGGRGR